MNHSHDERRETHMAPMEELMPLIRERLAAGQSIRFSPRGVSMLPMLRQGRDSVVISPVTAPLAKYDLPLYQRENGQYVLHRVVAVGDGYTCMGDNQFAKEPGIAHEQIIAVVTAFYREDKEYSTRAVSYRLYCRLWHISRPFRRLWRGAKSRLRRWLKRS